MTWENQRPCEIEHCATYDLMGDKVGAPVVETAYTSESKTYDIGKPTRIWGGGNLGTLTP